jgi:hypothetical protein
MMRIVPDYATYERRKAHWIALHPDATAAEYNQAMQRIANECGV